MYQSTEVSSEGNEDALIVMFVVPAGTVTISPVVKFCRSCCVIVSTNTRFVIAMVPVGDALGLELG